MATSSALIALLVVLGCAAAASAATITVGDSQGWTLGFDYANWASGKTFSVSDQLVFNFQSGQHTVTEVSKSEYDSCASGSNTIFSNGPATIPLSAAGTHYFICTVSGHCTGGMKLAVTVGGSSSGTPPSTTPGTTPSPTRPNSASTRVQAGAFAAAAAGVLVKLALL